MLNKKTKIRIAAICGFAVLFALLMWFLFSGGNFELLLSIFDGKHSRDEIRDKLAQFGFRGYITVTVLSMLQVVLTFLPAEPVQVLAGLTFGFPIGLLCCTVGVILGNSIIFALYRFFGDGIREHFVKNMHIDFERVSVSKKTVAVIFILYFLPAIPYGMICFLAASVGMKYPRYITVTTLGAIPSVCIGVGLGHIAIASNWIVSAVIFGVLVILLVIMMLKRDVLFGKLNSYIEKEATESNSVKMYKPRSLFIPYVVSKIILFFKGVRVKYTNRVGMLQTPSIVLCNHGSFIDFVYSGTMLRKYAPNFVVARLYFYRNVSAWLLKKYGCIPKSMFALDIESAKNCVKVLRSGGVLAMMPEARLSTAGSFEDIQEGTFAFLKKSAVPVYFIKMSGDYFAKPKWGKGLRRGSFVEAELDTLFTEEEIKSLSIDEIKSRTLTALDYNEFEWIKQRKRVHYRSKNLAEGLENILSKCPKCKEKYTIKTKNRKIFCEKCGKIAELDNRYSFVNCVPFENFGQWYKWQKEELQKEIFSDESFSLASPVTFWLPSLDGKTMKREAGAGICTLNREGLTYEGTLDGESTTLTFPISEIYRLLFGAGENFEIYIGKKIHYFVPAERRMAVDFYIASEIFRKLYEEKEN